MTAASPKNWYADKAPPNFNIHWTKIAHEFKDKALERRVFTAPGYGKGQAGAASAPDNELLEWLGDAILKKAQTLALFRLGTQKYGDQTEGGLTFVRAAMENNEFYAHVTRKIGLDRNLVTVNESQKQSSRVLGGLLEAYIGGLWLDLEKSAGVTAADEKVYEWASEVFTPFGAYYIERYNRKTEAEALEIAQKYVKEPPAGANINGLVAGLDNVSLSDGPEPRRPTAEELGDSRLPSLTSLLFTSFVVNQSSYKDHTFRGEFYYTISLGPFRGHPAQEVEGPLAPTKKQAKHLASRVACKAIGLI